MSQCTPDCPNDARILINVKPVEGDAQIVITNKKPIPPGTFKVTFKGKGNIVQQLDKIICKADDGDLNPLPINIDNGECLEFSFTLRQTAMQTLSCSGPKSAFDLGPDPPHFCIPQLNTIFTLPGSSPSTIPSPPTSSPSSSSPTSPNSSTLPTSSTSLTTPPSPSPRPSTTLVATPLGNPMITSTLMNPTSLSNILTPTISSTSILPTLPPPSETPGTSITNANKVTSNASKKGEVAGGVIGGIVIIVVIFLLWRRYRRLRSISTSQNEKAMTYRTSQRSSLWSSVPLTSSMLAEATKFDPTRMVKTGLPFDKNTPLAKNPTGGVHPLLPYS